MEYKASLDLKSKIITGFVAVLFVVISFFNFKVINFNSDDWVTPTILFSTTILLVFIFIYCYLFRPIKYIVGNGKVIIKRPYKDLKIDFSNIKETILPTPDSMRWTIRAFGNGGVFGYFGHFRNSTYGAMRWYATKTSNYLIIVTSNNDKIVLTPDDTGMINEMKKL